MAETTTNYGTTRSDARRLIDFLKQMESARQQAVKDLCKNPKWDYVEKSTLDKLIEFLSAGEDSSLEEVEKTALIYQCQSLDVFMVFHAVKTRNIDPEPLAGTPIYERLKLMSSSGPKHMQVISKDIKISLNAMAEGKFEKKGELSTSEKVREALEKRDRFVEKVYESINAYYELRDDTEKEIRSQIRALPFSPDDRTLCSDFWTLGWTSKIDTYSTAL